LGIKLQLPYHWNLSVPGNIFSQMAPAMELKLCKTCSAV
jgi:hypothetical protein